MNFLFYLISVEWIDYFFLFGRGYVIWNCLICIYIEGSIKMIFVYM